MTPYDDLLLWASERRAGNIAGLRAACTWTATQVGEDRRGRDVLDDLLALGHINLAEGRWSVVPSALIVLPDGGGHACFIGARPRWLLDALADLDHSQDWKQQGRHFGLHGIGPGSLAALSLLADQIYDYGLVEQAGPGTWFIQTGPGAPLSALAGLGVQVFHSAAEGALRSVRSSGRPVQVRTVRPGELSGRLVIDGPLTTATISWEPTNSDGTPGVYRYMRNNQVVYAERTTGQWLEMDYRWAVWRAAHTSPCVGYEPRSRRMFLPTTVRPPLALERALLLRTGRLPTQQPSPNVAGAVGPVTVYENMTNAVATDVAALLGKETKLV